MASIKLQCHVSNDGINEKIFKNFDAFSMKVKEYVWCILHENKMSKLIQKLWFIWVIPLILKKYFTISQISSLLRHKIFSKWCIIQNRSMRWNAMAPMIGDEAMRNIFKWTSNPCWRRRLSFWNRRMKWRSVGDKKEILFNKCSSSVLDSETKTLQTHAAANLLKPKPKSIYVQENSNWIAWQNSEGEKSERKPMHKQKS